MSSSDDNSPNSSSRHKEWIAVWAIVLAVLFGFGWYKSAENAHEQRLAREWETRYQQSMKDGDVEWKRLAAHFRSLQLKPGSQQLLEEELNGRQPFALRQEGTVGIVEWTDPKYGGHFWLKFRDGVLRGHSGNWGTARLLAVYPQQQGQADKNTAEWLRRQIASVGGYTWLAAFVTWVLVTRRRLWAAQVLLAAALACGMAWLVNPRYTLTWQGIFRNDDLCFAVVMLFVSVSLLAVTFAEDSHGRLSVAPFHFRLRDLLLTVTVVAVMLAAGPFGYVTLLVGLAGMIVFAGVFYRFQSRVTLPFS